MPSGSPVSIGSTPCSAGFTSPVVCSNRSFRKPWRPCPPKLPTSLSPRTAPAGRRSWPWPPHCRLPSVPTPLEPDSSSRVTSALECCATEGHERRSVMINYARLPQLKVWVSGDVRALTRVQVLRTLVVRERAGEPAPCNLEEVVELQGPDPDDPVHADRREP